MNAIRSLVLKDILIQKPMIAAMGLYSLFFFVLFGVLDETPPARFVYMIDGIVVAVVMAMGSFKGEKKSPDAFTGSLPVSRRAIVIGKFTVLFLGAAYGLVTAGAIGVILRLAVPQFCSEYLSLRAILGVFIGAAAFSFVIPLSLLLGQTGVKAILVGFLSITVAINFLTFLPLSEGGNRNSPVVSVIEALEKLGQEGRFLLFGAIGAIMLVLSLGFSLMRYPKKDY